MGSALPYRLDLDDDEIEAIKTFDVDTQRTLYPVKEVRLLPAREFPLDDAGPRAVSQPLARGVRGRPVEDAPVQGRLQRRAGRRASSTTCRCSSTRRRRSFDYLPRGTHARAAPATSRGAIERLLARRRVALQAAARRPGPAAAAAARAVRAGRGVLRRALKAFARVDLLAEPTRRSAARCADAAAAAGRGRPPRRRSARRAQALPRHARGLRVLVAAESPGRRETMAHVLRRVRPAARAVRRASRRSCSRDAALRARASRRSRTASSCRAEGWAVVTEAELYAGVVRRRAARRGEAQLGRGRCCATSPSSRSATRWCTSSTASAATRAWSTWTSAKARPSSCSSSTTAATSSTCRSRSSHLISRYSGAQPEEAPLHKLGSGQWDKAKARAAQAGARHRRRAAQALRASAPRARATRSRSGSTTTRRSPTASASRRRPTRRRRSRR